MDHVKNFLSTHAKAGSTEVCTEVAAPVTQEHITKHEHVETAEAIDRERHIHHHQHRVQPVAATEHLATEHETNVVPEITREQRVEMPAEHEAKLAAQHQQYTNTQTIGETERTAAHLGTSVNEHVHHHVHEHIQPVIQKETHAHKTVHTVIPVHEKIHEAPIVHESTVLPTVSLDEFSRAHAGSATETHGASAHKHAFYEGEPKAAGTTGVHSHTDKNHHHGKEGVQPVHNSQALNQADPRVDSDRTTGVAHTGVGAIGNQDTTTHAAVPGATSTSGKPVGSAVAGSGATATHPSTTTAETTPHKKSLVEKIKDVL